MDELGRRGEDLAARYLERTGYVILARNWRTGRLEIDIVARRGGTVAFVEVKTRRSGPQHPTEAVDRQKRARIGRAAARWIAGRTADRPADRPAGRTAFVEYRFDVITVRVGRNGRCRLRHDEGAFTRDDV